MFRYPPPPYPGDVILNGRLYFIIMKVNGCLERINESKYLKLVSTNEQIKILMENCGVKEEI